VKAPSQHQYEYGGAQNLELWFITGRCQYMDSDGATSRTNTSLPAGSTDNVAIQRKTARDCPGIALALLTKARSGASALVPTVNPHEMESAVQTITKLYIDGVFVESHSREVMDSINDMRDDPQAP